MTTHRVDFAVSVDKTEGAVWVDGQKVPMDRNLAALLIIRLKQMYPSIEEVV